VKDSEAEMQALRDKAEAAQRAVQAAKEASTGARSSFREAQSAHEAGMAAVAATAKARSDAEVAAAAAVRRASRKKVSPLAGALQEHSAVLAAPMPWVSGQQQPGRMSIGAVSRLFSKARTSRAAASLVAQDVAERQAQAASDQRLLAAVHGARDAEFDARVKAAALKKGMSDAKSAIVAAEAARAMAVAHLNAAQRALTAAQGRHARVSNPVVMSDDDVLSLQQTAARASSSHARPSTAGVPGAHRVPRQGGGTSAWVRAKMAATQQWAARVAATTAKAAAGDARVAAQRQARVSKLQEQKEKEAQRLAAATIKRTESLKAAEDALTADATRRGALEPPAPAVMPSFAPLESPLAHLAPEYSMRRVSQDRSSFVVSATPRSFLRSPRTLMTEDMEAAAATRAARASGGNAGDAPAVCVGLTPSRPPPSAALVSPRQGNSLGVVGINLH
jgi:hypothetical protein